MFDGLAELEGEQCGAMVVGQLVGKPYYSPNRLVIRRED